jgi:hypothetical protein
MAAFLADAVFKQSRSGWMSSRTLMFRLPMSWKKAVLHRIPGNQQTGGLIGLNTSAKGNALGNRSTHDL